MNNDHIRHLDNESLIQLLRLGLTNHAMGNRKESSSLAGKKTRIIASKAHRTAETSTVGITDTARFLHRSLSV